MIYYKPLHYIILYLFLSFTLESWEEWKNLNQIWTKPWEVVLGVGGGDGRGGGPWWGENGDNGTWTTIKKEKEN